VSGEPRLVCVGRAVPERTYSQQELYAFNPFERTPLLDRLFLDSPIRTRSLFVPPEFHLGGRSAVEANQAWREGALHLGGAALQEALELAGVAPSSLDVIGVTTVTGTTTPGLDVLLAAGHGLRADVQRLHFQNIGCHAAVPLLRSVADHVARRPGSLGVAVAVEVCSACLRFDRDPQNLVAASLFADGAAAAVVSTEGDGPRLVDFAAGFDFASLELLGFELADQGLRIILDPAVPERVGAAVGPVVDRLLASHGLRRADVPRWAIHPGGSRVLDAAQAALGLSDAAMEPSRRVLADHGNMSSPSVLFALAEALEEPLAPGEPLVMASFGPGLGVEAALLVG
jgi:predicted naringenin-chalcone synthase